MNIKTKLILSAALLAVLSAPAMARSNDDDGRSAYADFRRGEQAPVVQMPIVTPAKVWRRHVAHAGHVRHYR